MTVFPMPIALGASFDLDLIKKISNITAIEARALYDKVYKLSQGKTTA